MEVKVANDQSELIGGTPLLKLESLSRICGSEIYVKCEHMNPGGSVKDRAALGMIRKAVSEEKLKSGMTIVEGTAGNTGIGLALVGKALGYKVRVVMPKGQTHEKERMIALFGAELQLVDACPFKDPKHFYHTARRMAEESPERYWWADQFENTANAMAHYETTGPEIWHQLGGEIDALVSVAGTGGTIGGTSRFLREQKADIKIVLVDPMGSGLKSFVETGEFKSSGSSFTEGIGIMRLTANFRMASVDQALSFPDQDIVTVSRFVRDHDGVILGSSSALNVTAALATALEMGPGKKLVTFACDLGERSFSKLYNEAFLKEKGIDSQRSIEAMRDDWSL